MSIDDAWLRDTGPIFVEDVQHDASSSCVSDGTGVAPDTTVAGWRRPRAPGTVAAATDGLSKRTIGLCFTFDAWGGYCYDDWTNDALVGRKVCGIERLPAVPRAMVLEGGAVRFRLLSPCVTVVWHVKSGFRCDGHCYQLSS